MQERKVDIWTCYKDGGWVCIPTNGDVNAQGNAIMGRGVAKQAVVYFQGTSNKSKMLLQQVLGNRLRQIGNIPFVFYDWEVISFPTKHHWNDKKADIKLIKQSAIRLKDIMDTTGMTELFLPRVGCGNGKLIWQEVRPVLKKIFDNRFIVVSK